MASYTRRNKEQWQELIEEQQSSGLSQKDFCQQKGLSKGTFVNWKRKLKGEKREGISSTPPWIELPPTIPATNSRWHIELDLGNGVCLRLSQAD